MGSSGYPDLNQQTFNTSRPVPPVRTQTDMSNRSQFSPSQTVNSYLPSAYQYQPPGIMYPSSRNQTSGTAQSTFSNQTPEQNLQLSPQHQTSGYGTNPVYSRGSNLPLSPNTGAVFNRSTPSRIPIRPSNFSTSGNQPTTARVTVRVPGSQTPRTPILPPVARASRTPILPPGSRASRTPISPPNSAVTNSSFVPRPLSTGSSGVSIPPMPPRSPGRITDDEETQMRLAIAASLQDMNDTGSCAPFSPATSPRSPSLSPRSPLLSPRSPLLSPIVEDDTEDDLLQGAILASIEAAEQSRLANFHANQVLMSPPASPPVQRINEDREIIRRQNEEYAESLRIDQERAEAAKRAAEAAEKAAYAAEESARMLQMSKAAEEAKIEALQPPELEYPIELGSAADIFSLRFRLPSGGVVTHSFHRSEPLSSLIQQLQFDAKHPGDLILTIPPRSIIDCPPDTPIEDCGIENRIVISVGLP